MSTVFHQYGKHWAKESDYPGYFNSKIKWPMRMLRGEFACELTPGQYYSSKWLHDWCMFNISHSTEEGIWAFYLMGHHRICYPEEKKFYRIELTDSNPKSSRANGNSNGKYLLLDLHPDRDTADAKFYRGIQKILQGGNHNAH